MVRVDPERDESARPEPTVSDFSITGRSMTGWALVPLPGAEGRRNSGGVERTLSVVRQNSAREVITSERTTVSRCRC